MKDSSAMEMMSLQKSCFIVKFLRYLINLVTSFDRHRF